MDRYSLSSPKGWIVDIYGTAAPIYPRKFLLHGILYFFLLCLVPSLRWKQEYAEFPFFLLFPKARISCVSISYTAFLRKGSHLPSPAFGNGCPHCRESDSPALSIPAWVSAEFPAFPPVPVLCEQVLPVFFPFPWEFVFPSGAAPVLPWAQGFL